MKKADCSFRLQVRCNRVEDAALYEDLMQYPDGFARAGRIRCLLRLGLAAAHTALNPAPAPIKKPGPSFQQPGEQLDRFILDGFDIQQFSFVGDAQT